uniref:Peptidase S1 domain-containing protein n=1 Tax=Anopheles dirus TaxID=7168 RepID=A0A182NS13_9DIPT
MSSKCVLAGIIAAVVLIGCLETVATQIECTSANERCVGLENCSKPPQDPATAKLSHVQCTPQVQSGAKVHVCCEKRHIKCYYKGQRGVCVPRGNCPMLKSITEHEQVVWSNQQPCYVHQDKEYLCCTYDKCVMHPNLCDTVKPEMQQSASSYPVCYKNGTQGSLVSTAICDVQDQLARSHNSVCCAPPTPDRLISHPKAAVLAAMPCGGFERELVIEDGEVAKRGEFPWMAFLVYVGNQTRCGGTLIHPSYVLTAKDCISSDPKPTHVLLGVSDLRKTPPCHAITGKSACDQVQRIAIAEILIHDMIDIGLLQLASRAQLREDRVHPICLPLYASLRIHMPRNVIVTGWGESEGAKPTYMLMKANTTVVMRGKECPNDQLICVGGVNYNTPCNGDTGGPYQAISKFGASSGYVQYGIISKVPPDCTNPDGPSSGPLVTYFINWILDRIDLSDERKP